MRLTTKIVLGIIGAIFLASITCIIVLSIGYEKMERKTIEQFDRQIQEDNKKKVAISVPSYKSMILNFDRSEDDDLLDRVRTFIGGTIYFTSAPIDSFDVVNLSGEKINNEKRTLLVPETLAPYVKWTIRADGTLVLCLKPSEDLLYPYKESDFYLYRPKIEIIALSDAIEGFHSNISNINANFNGINTTLMDVGTQGGNIDVSDCNIEKFIPKIRGEKYVHLNISNSKIKDLNIDFSSGLHLNTNQCEIETGHFRGNTDAWNVNGKSNFKKIHWAQSDKGEPLNFNLKTDSVTLVFP